LRHEAALVLADILRSRVHRLIAVGGLCVVLVGLVWALACGITGRRVLAPLDGALLDGLFSLRTPFLDRLMMGLSALGDGIVRTPATALVAGYLLWRRRWSWAVGLAAAMIGAAILTPVLKTMFHIARPTPIYAGADAFSFPSGHATSTTALYIMLAWIASRSATPGKRFAPWSLAAIMILLTGISRVYLGAHWPSDVLAGFAVGTVLAIAGVLIAGGMRPEFDTKVRVGVPILACLMITALILAPGAYGKALRLYGPYLRDGLIAERSQNLEPGSSSEAARWPAGAADERR
jgi:membrane-associated phospholipid phosphatase